MCDAEMFEAVDSDSLNMGRRTFAAITAGMGAAALWPSAALALQNLQKRDVMIQTHAGTADAYFTAPSSGKHPAVLIWPDIRGLRPAFRMMADRLAAEGYAVLCVNPFYRWQAGAAMKEGEQFTDAPVRERLFGWMRQLTRPLIAADTHKFTSFLDAQSATDPELKMTVTGYCMGGPMAIYSAAEFPERVGAVASFHGAGVATDKPESPHLVIAETSAAYLFAIAEDDDAKEPLEKERLNAILAGRDQWHEVEVYPAKHGWCPPDSHVYEAAAAERAWSRMLSMMQQEKA